MEIATDKNIISIQIRAKEKNDILYSNTFKIVKIINIEEIDSIKILFK